MSDLIQLIEDLTSSEECDFDHHGYCQAHNWFSERPCPHGRAKEWLASL